MNTVILQTITVAHVQGVVMTMRKNKFRHGRLKEVTSVRFEVS